MSINRGTAARIAAVADRLGLQPQDVLDCVSLARTYNVRAMLTPAASSPKLSKNGGYVLIHSAVMYLRAGGPAECPAADAGCAGCYGEGGRAAMFAAVNAARDARTAFVRRDRAAAAVLLALEIETLRGEAIAGGMLPAVRLNGLSDIPWESVRAGECESLMSAYPEVQFWDYTRVPGRLRTLHTLPLNYHLTWSLGADNDRISNRAASMGLNVSAVFRGPLPERFAGRPVINGDLHDFRFLDSPGVIVGLKAKGPARRDTTGFVRTADYPDFDLSRVPRFGR